MNPTSAKHTAARLNRLLVVLTDASAGGGVRVVGGLVRGWGALGVHVETLSLATSSPTGREILRHAPHESLDAPRSVQRLLRLRQYLRKGEHKFDVVFAIGDYPAAITLVARQLLPKHLRPLIVNGVHQPRPYVTSIESSRRSRWVRWAAVRTVHAVLRRIDGYVFLNEPQKLMYRDFGPHPEVAQVVMPNPVRFGNAEENLLVGRQSRLQRGEQIRLITVGALNDQKNHLLLLEALARLEPRFVLTIVGGGERGPALRARIRALDLANRVQLLGHREDIADLLDQHDVFVLSSDYEASPPLVVLEAMVRGLPVVSTDCAPGSRELGTALASYSVVPLRDANSLAREVRKVAANPVSIPDLFRAAAEVLEKHSPLHSAQQHLDFFHSVKQRKVQIDHNVVPGS